MEVICDMSEKDLTTFQAAKLLSVSPDAVLKWIKSGIIDARRTPGGHHRIAKKSIKSLLKKHETVTESGTKHHSQSFQFCWQFNSEQKNCTQECSNCLVYKSRAKYCYEMSTLPRSAGQLKLYCKSSCNECKYYEFLKAYN